MTIFKEANGMKFEGFSDLAQYRNLFELFSYTKAYSDLCPRWIIFELLC